MTQELIRSYSLLGVIVAPLFGFLLIAILGFRRKSLREDQVAMVAKWSSIFAAISVATLLGEFVVGRAHFSIERYSSWISFGEHRFDIVFAVNSLSLGFLILVTLLSGLVGKFSRRYIHQEEGFTRFYLLLLLATFGMNLVVMADSIGLTIIGWEFLGIASTLLIAFFHSRRGPRQNALTAFIVYRIADIGLLFALIYAHGVFGTTQFSSFIHTDGGPYGTFDGNSSDALILGLFFLLSASGKSSVLPFIPWLPSAMEGPTPSSAIFYGAFAVHAGPYLFLRSAPLVESSPTLACALVVLGVASALLASLVGRVRSDVKTALAYATIAQVSMIYVEIGLGWYYLAAIHAAGHMCLRTYQYLRAPSALHDLHIRSVLGVAALERESFFDRVLSKKKQLWLYRLAIEQGTIATIYQRILIGPILQLGEYLSQLESFSEASIDRILRGPKQRGEGGTNFQLPSLSEKPQISGRL